MKKILLLLSIFLFISINSFSQIVEWNFRYEFVTNNPQEVDIYIDIKIPDGFHMYSFDQGPGGPLAAEVQFKHSNYISKIGKLVSLTKPREYFDDVFGITTRDFAGKITWKQRFKINPTIQTKITGTYSYQICQEDGMCKNPFPVDFEIAIPAQKNSIAPNSVLIEKSNSTIIDTQIQKKNTDIPKKDSSITTQIDDSISNTKETNKEHMSLFWIFIAGFIGGLLAFVTPCVFPMVPLTVSMFIKKSKEKVLRDVIIFGVSIVVIFVSLGIFITMAFGVDALYKMSTDPWFNIGFFLVFVVFAISFFGAFELMLPSNWINYMDKKADSSSGLFSIFFMAFTLVLVSFSCTAMIIGTLLVQSVVSGALLGPLMGMLGFSIALALPFTIFAMFPSMLKSLPKSGGWLNTVKVFLGFVELGFALKFFSNADLVSGWGLLPRNLFLGIWVILMILLGLYLIKIIDLIKDFKNFKLTKLRLFFGIISFIFTGYLITGFYGAPLNPLSGYLPPITEQSQNTAHKYSDIFHSPFGIDGFYDYDEGLAYAKKVNKPVLLDFTGKACANCRKVEMNVWSQPEVLKIIKEKYVLISLYVDSREPLEKSKIRSEKYAGKTYKITTIGENWSIFMMKNYGGLMQPYYVLLSPEGKRLTTPITYTEAQDIKTYKEFLETGIAKMKE